MLTLPPPPPKKICPTQNHMTPMFLQSPFVNYNEIMNSPSLIIVCLLNFFFHFLFRHSFHLFVSFFISSPFFSTLFFPIFIISFLFFSYKFHFFFHLYFFNLFHFLFIKAILRDVMGEETMFTFIFFIIHLCNDPCCHRILSPQCIRAGYRCVIWNIVHSMSSHSIPHCKLYRDPGKGQVIADCVITPTLLAFIFTRYCLFLMIYRFM